MRLTLDSIKKIPAPESGYQIIWDSELKGFGIRVTAGNARAFIAEARVNGRKRRVTLGRVGVITAEEARKKAKRKLADMGDGIDPAAEKRREKALGVTLSEVAAAYLESHPVDGDGNVQVAMVRLEVEAVAGPVAGLIA